jgi:hypothetical protein
MNDNFMPIDMCIRYDSYVMNDKSESLLCSELREKY